MLRCGDEFQCYRSLHDAILAFADAELIQLYVRSSRTIKSALESGRTRNKNYNEDLIYTEIDYACIHGGKSSKRLPLAKDLIKSKFASLHLSP